MIDWDRLVEEEVISSFLAQIAKRAGSSVEDQVVSFLAFNALESGNTLFSEDDYPVFLPNIEWEQSELIGDTDELKPILKLETGKYQIQRLWKQEQEIRTFLANQTEIKSEIKPDLAFIKQVLDESDLNTAQAEVMKSIVNHSIILLTGGPGTGKTYTIVRLMASFFHHFDNKNTRLALAAPTGKAAARMLESINSSMQKLKVSESIKAQFPNDAFTIHRLLGISNNALKAKYNHKNPLPHDCVIIDESSMLDVNLFFALIRALKKDAKLVLVGDSDQLPSVEVGAILSDLCKYGEDENQPEKGGQISLSFDEQKASDIKIKRIHLSKSYRFSDTSSIGILAKKVNNQDIESVIETFEKPDLKWIKVRSIVEMQQEVKNWYKNHLQELHTGNTNQVLFETLKNQMIICGLRVGLWGSEGINKMLIREFEKIGNGSKNGFPIMINTNDYNHQLFNSDIGLYVEENDTQKIVFEERAGAYRYFNPGVIQSIMDPAFSMTVHKSQGSEYEHILLVLPDKDEHGLLTKELIYTAITRAKKSFTLLGNAEVLKKAIGKRMNRKTGL